MRALLTVAVCLLLAAPAHAHTLTAAGAERVSERYAKRIAGLARPVPSVMVDRCFRRTRHRVDCFAVYRFGGVVCERRVRVRFTSDHHRRVSVRFVGPTGCF